MVAYFLLPIASYVFWHKVLPFLTDGKGVRLLVTFPLLSMAWLFGGGLAWFFWVLDRESADRARLVLGSVLIVTLCWALGFGVHS
jgi:hypothetical protein